MRLILTILVLAEILGWTGILLAIVALAFGILLRDEYVHGTRFLALAIGGSFPLAGIGAAMVITARLLRQQRQRRSKGSRSAES
jgi:hypothetical protein